MAHKNIGGFESDASVEDESNVADDLFSRSLPNPTIVPKLKSVRVAKSLNKGSRLVRTKLGNIRDSTEIDPGEDILVNQEEELDNIALNLKSMKALKSLWASINLVSNDLNSYIKQHVTTKVEIKKAVEKLEDLLISFDIHFNRLEGEVANVVDQSLEKKEVVQSKSLHIQGDLEIALEGQKRFENIKKFLYVKWPRKFFKNTKWCKKVDIVDCGADFICTVNNVGVMPEDEVHKGLEAKFSGLVKLIADVNELDYIQLDSTRRTKLMPTGDRNSEKIFVVPLNKSNDGTSDWDRLYKDLDELRAELEQNNKSVFKMVIGVGVESYVVRKLAEAVFRNTEVSVDIMSLDRTTKEVNVVGKPHVTRITVRAEGKSYADMLREMKDKIDLPTVGVKINRIRKTESGDLAMAVEGGDGGIKRLGESIQENMNWKVVTRLVGVSTIIISGIEAGCTINNVRDVVAEAAGLSPEVIETKSFRENRFQEKTLEVVLPRDGANRLIVLGEIGIGWVRCKVREKVKIQRCFNCLELGHYAKDCSKQKVGEDICLNCSKSGHRVKDCSNDSWCKRCNLAGHRGDQIRCPYFRAEIDRVRKKKIDKLLKVVSGSSSSSDGSKK